MSTTTRRGLIGALAASGATRAVTHVNANPHNLDLAALKKDTDVASRSSCVS